tara:strand:+ start:13432 stop:14304 length:873 start_codon:yes stop_codon:yes gene_type:complete
MSTEERVWTVLSMLEWATDYFVKRDVQDPRLSIEWLLAETLAVKRLDLYLQFDRPLSSDELELLRPLIQRRAKHEPLQHITGSTQFMNATIAVSPDVLIPRIETEQLVDLLFEQTQSISDRPLKIIDLGTGSGCIPIAIKKNRPKWECTGIDISEAALQLARENAQSNSVDVTFQKANIENLQEQLSGRWDIVISNPPYITMTEKKEMHKQVLEYEPHLALFYDNPLHLYKNILQFASESNAKLFLECNDKTAEKVAQIAEDFFSEISLLNDLDGNKRFVIASDKGSSNT